MSDEDAILDWPSSQREDYDAAAVFFAALAVRAGALAMERFATSMIGARLKNDHSPVSEADELIEAFLLERLMRAAPELPVIAEEMAERGIAPVVSRAFLLVDPLDGTREFLAHRSEFTINIALAVAGTPRAGAVFAPALGKLWLAGERAFAVKVTAGGALPPREQWRELRVRPRLPNRMTALVSRSHLDEQTRAFLKSGGVADIREVGSSLKFCWIAEGEADVYPRFGPTMEWDTAAGDAILRAAGGVTLTPGDEPFVYGKWERGYRNGPFIAWGGATLS